MKEGFDVRIAGDGGKAIEEFQKQVPDLILLDLMMPQVDGYTVCRQIRQDPRSPSSCSPLWTERTPRSRPSN